MIAAATVPVAVGKPSRRRRWFVAGALLVALGAGVYFGLAWLSGRRLREAVAETDRLDPHWRLEDLEARRAAVPDDENGALVVLKARALIPADWPQWPEPGATNVLNKNHIVLSDPDFPLSRVSALALSEEMARAAPALAEARRLHDRPRGRYPASLGPDSLFAPLPCDGVQAVALLLHVQAALEASHGDADGALATIRCLVNVARSIGDEPTPMSQVLRAYIGARAVRAVERVLAHGRPSAEALATTRRVFLREAGEPILPDAYRAERAFLHEALTHARSVNTARTFPGIVTGARLKLALAAGRVQRDHPELLRLMNEAVAASRLPPSEQTAAFDRLDERWTAVVLDHEILMRLSLLRPAASETANLLRPLLGQMRCAAVALAAEGFRVDQGRWPETLGELVPAYLDDIPIDPCDGSPLRFKRLPDGLVIYSVGNDGQGDGGYIERTLFPPWPGQDVGVRLWDVEKRWPPTFELLRHPAVSP